MQTPTKPKSKPASANIVHAQTAALAIAVASAKHGNLTALEAFIVVEQAKRNKTGAESYHTYRLWRGVEAKFYEGVMTPSGIMYADEMTLEGVRRFIDCPDQTFVDAVNAAAREFGVLKRLETKHATIEFLLDRALYAGTIAWIEVAGGVGFITAPHPDRLPCPTEDSTAFEYETDSEMESEFRQEMDQELAAARELEQAEAALAESDRAFQEAKQSYHSANHAYGEYMKRVRAGSAPGDPRPYIDAINASNDEWNRTAAIRSSAISEVGAAWARVAQAGSPSCPIAGKRSCSVAGKAASFNE